MTLTQAFIAAREKQETVASQLAGTIAPMQKGYEVYTDFADITDRISYAQTLNLLGHEAAAVRVLQEGLDK